MKNITLNQLNCLLTKPSVQFDREIYGNQVLNSSDQPDKMMLWTFKNVTTDVLLAIVEKDVNKMVLLEQKHNGTQPVDSIRQQIRMAQTMFGKILFADNNFKTNDCKVVNALSHMPLHEVLLNCMQCLINDSSKVLVVLSETRREIIESIFGRHPDECNECVTTPFLDDLGITGSVLTYEWQQQLRQHIHTTQIIFDNGDYVSALNELVINLFERNQLPWQPRSVFIQESLKDQFASFVETSGLSVRSVLEENDAFDPIRAIVHKTNGKLLQNKDRTISLMVNVPTKYVIDVDGNWATVNFFRTMKDVCQILNNEKCIADTIKYTSIWTENVSLLYQIAFSLKTFVVWNNCFGVFDDVVPCPMAAQNWTLTFNAKYNR